MHKLGYIGGFLFLFLMSCTDSSSTRTVEQAPVDEVTTQPENRENLAPEVEEVSTHEKSIKQIKEAFDLINADQELYVDTLQLDDAGPSPGQLFVFYDAVGELRKMVASYHGEGGNTVEEYYVKDAQLFFSYKKLTQYGRPPNMDEATYKKEHPDEQIPEDKVLEDRYYFDKDAYLIRHINSQEEILEEDKIHIELEKKVQQSFQQLYEKVQQMGTQTETEEVKIAAPNEALHTWMKSIAESKSFSYTYDTYDLNGDGVDEYLCGLRGEFWCGSGGCSFIILQQTPGGLKLHSRGGPTYGPHLISQEENGGWHTLILDPTIGTTQDGEKYKNYPVLVYKDGAYEQEWLDDLDVNERLDLLLEDAQEVLTGERDFHSVAVAEK